MSLLIKETPLQRIIRKTGRKPVQCKCRLCKQQCHTPCLGTPQDILKLIEAGLKPTEGRLSHHSIRLDNFKPSKSIAWNVAKEWLNEENVEYIVKICEAMEADNKMQLT